GVALSGYTGRKDEIFVRAEPAAWSGRRDGAHLPCWTSAARRHSGRLLALMSRVVKSVITVFVLSLLLTACRHAHPEAGQIEREKRSTEAEIRQHLVGEWTCASASDGCWYPRLIIAADGSLTGVLDNGRREFIGTWQMSGSL